MRRREGYHFGGSRTPAVHVASSAPPMPPSEDSASAPLEPTAEWLGYLVLVPFVLCLAGVGLLSEPAARELAQRIALGWGAVLLAFGGAVHFGLALAHRLPASAAHTGAAVVPALIGAAAVVLGGQRGLALLVVGWGAFWLYEHRVLGTQLPAAYLALRRQLTLAACILLALTLFASDAAGLS
jgi:uncharacterized protein DUF3429